MSKAICIHPYDSSTFFLREISFALKKILQENIDIIDVAPNSYSHERTIKILSNLFNDELVIFLGHGGSNYVLGACGDYADALVSSDFEEEYPDKIYRHGNFIDSNNIEILKNNKIFCLSCNSGEELGKLAIEAGAKSFLGFNYIPTSEEEFKLKGFSATYDDVTNFKIELSNIIIASLTHAIKKSLSFYELKSFMYIYINKRMNFLVRNKEAVNRRLIVDALYFFKKGIIIYGDESLPLF